MAKKSLLGNKVRRLRQDRGLTQQQMADQLGISPSYINLIEHDERPVTVSLLLKLGQAFNVDLQELSGDEERRIASQVREAFADPTLGAPGVDAEQIARLVATAPEAARAIVSLYRGFKTAREDAQAMTIGLPGGEAKRIVLPTEEARDFFESRANHFPEIEAEAETLWRNAGLDPGEPDRALIAHLQRKHGISVEIAPADPVADGLRRFDSARRRLVLSEALPPPSRRFHIAYQLGLLEAHDAFDKAIQAAKLQAGESEVLCRVGLANYFAGAVLMPYGHFLAAARKARYDLEVLMHRFNVSFEQACHRISTLQRAGERGVPFFFVRVDLAGNVTKRFSLAGFPLSRFGGSCPRWVAHMAFLTPGIIRRQVARLPDGATSFCIARTVERPGGNFRTPSAYTAIGIGCEIAHARELVYADGLDLASADASSEIGPGCRLCERPNCRQRAFPPLHHRLVVDATVKGPSAYAFDIEGVSDE